jgi:DNA (cytosine-5)-methyltransferase 1
MKYLSLFSGIGGFELGIQQAYESYYREFFSKQTHEAIPHYSTDDSGRSTRATCIGYSEIDKYAIQIYQKHFPNHKNYGDIKTINESELPAFDLLVGGFPCQSFSIAGKRGGFSDTRGTLFFDIGRIIKQKQPRLLLLENVKGLLSHDQGQTFYTIISTLDELGYDIQWQVLNSKNHGVPQNRERVFIIGHLRGTPRPQVFPFGENDQVFNGQNEPDERRSQTENSHTLRGSNVKADQVFIRQVNNPKHSNERVYDPEGISPTLNTMQGGQRQPFIIGGLQKHQAVRKDGISPTLTQAMGQGGGQTPIIMQRPRGKNKGGRHEIAPTLSSNSWENNNTLGAIRRLTPTECERLQGFPDGWTEGLSDTQRYKTLGNAVTVNVIRDIIKEIL